MGVTGEEGEGGISVGGTRDIMMEGGGRFWVEGEGVIRGEGLIRDGREVFIVLERMSDRMEGRGVAG